jgi:hypothetical protein
MIIWVENNLFDDGGHLKVGVAMFQVKGNDTVKF